MFEGDDKISLVIYDKGYVYLKETTKSHPLFLGLKEMIKKKS